MTTTQEKLPEIKIPNLGGLITADDLYYKGKVPYCSWAKTAQRIRENAPNWFFALEPDPNGQIVWLAPNNTGYLMGYFFNIESGIKLPLYPYAITDFKNNPIIYEKISSNDILKAHRRCLCACGCYSFGDAFELWAGLEVKESNEEEKTPPATAPGTSRTPTKTNQKLAPVSEQAKKNPPITTDARNLIMDQLKDLNKTNPDKYKEIALAFINEFKVPKLTGYISEARHGEFLSHAISKIDDNK